MRSREHGVEHLALLLVGRAVRPKETWPEEKTIHAVPNLRLPYEMRQQMLDIPEKLLSPVIVFLVLDVYVVHRLRIVDVQHPRLQNNLNVNHSRRLK